MAEERPTIKDRKSSWLASSYRSIKLKWQSTRTYRNIDSLIMYQKMYNELAKQ